MRKVDFYIKHQCWMLKDLQAWAEAAATVVSVAISVMASMAVRAIGMDITGQRGAGAGVFLKDFGKEHLGEIAEELVPIFGEWFYTAYSMAGHGSWQQRGTLASGTKLHRRRGLGKIFSYIANSHLIIMLKNELTTLDII